VGGVCESGGRVGRVVWYFAYGWTLDKNLLKRSVGEWGDARRAELNGFRLVFDSYSASWRGGVANLRGAEGGKVYGVVYEITQEQLKTLDRLEGVPSSSARRRVEVNVEGLGRLKAFTHVAVNPRGRWIKPSREYLSAMLRGLRQHGFGEEVLRETRRLASPPQ